MNDQREPQSGGDAPEPSEVDLDVVADAIAQKLCSCHSEDCRYFHEILRVALHGTPEEIGRMIPKKLLDVVVILRKFQRERETARRMKSAAAQQKPPP